MKQDTVSVLITVGTTRFDEFVGLFSRQDIVSALVKAGVGRLVVQHGTSPTFNREEAEKAGIDVEEFEYRPSLEPCIAEADLVISHAAMGTILHVLAAIDKGQAKHFIVVANRSLSGDHQKDCASMIQSHTEAGEWPGDVFMTWEELEAFLLSGKLDALTKPLRDSKKCTKQVSEEVFGYPSERTGLSNLVQGMLKEW